MSGPERPGSISSRLEGYTPGALVVEDEPDIVAFMGAFFRASGTRLEHVDPSTAAEVVEAALDLRVGCVLLDMGLRVTNGFEVITALRAEPRLAGLPVIVVSANDSTDVRRRVVALGADDFVAKPFQVRRLYAQVAALVEMAEESFVGHDELARQVNDLVRSEPNEPAVLALLEITDIRGGGFPPFEMTQISTRVQNALPMARVIGWTSNEEIAVTFDTSSQSAAAAVNGILHQLPSLEITAGLAAYPGAGRTADELYMAADSALAEAIERGTHINANL